MSLGEVIKEVREASPYRDLRSFASQVGLSYEGLRKIELEERVPSAKTIEDIIAGVGIDDDLAQQLRVSRDLAHAERENLLNKGVTDEKIEELASACRDTVVEFLGEFEMGLEEGDQEDLLARLTESILGELRA